MSHLVSVEPVDGREEKEAAEKRTVWGKATVQSQHVQVLKDKSLHDDIGTRRGRSREDCLVVST